jgi:hypothetical protein
MYQHVLEVLGIFFLATDLLRQVGTGQTGVGIVGERAGELLLGQSVAVAAACIMAGALGGNQQQVQLLSFKFLSLLKSEACSGHMVSVECHLLFVVSLIKTVLLYIVWPKCERTFYAHGQWGHRRREQ